MIGDVIYEVEFVLDDDVLEATEMDEPWLSEITISLGTWPTVRAFRFYREVDADESRFKLTLAFDNPSDCEAFRTDIDLREHFTRIERTSKHVRTTIWEPALHSHTQKPSTNV